jgi:HAD superfamily hydrolase (TIGR01509 family)
MTQAVIFDLDGLLLDSEGAWDAARERVARDAGGRWHKRAQADMMGMSSVEWSRYMHDELGVPLSHEEINAAVVQAMEDLYRRDLPLIDGAREAVERVSRWPLGLASSSNRPVIDLALELSGMTGVFAVTVSSEEVARGKPAPDVYLEAARRLDVAPADCAAIEDSHNGILAAHAAGMWVVAVPNAAFPPGEESLARADVVVGSLHELDERVVRPG